jgi:lipopolysaccharide transport system ATP-binding protein
MSAIVVQQLGKQYRLASGPRASYRTLRESLAETFTRLRRGARSQANTFWALQDVSFTIPEGGVVGIIGHNGAGKSTLLKILSRITKPTTGRVALQGRVGSLLEVGTGFHPELSGRENIYLNGSILGMSRREIQRRFDEIVAFAEVEQFLETPVKRYSSGMYVRLAFAVAAHLEPEILLVDEVLAVGDIQFQKKCLEKMQQVSRSGRTVLFVSHNLSSVRTLCKTALTLEAGKLVGLGDAEEQVRVYLQKIASQSLTSLESRQDREGDGSARITNLVITDLAGEPLQHAFSGQGIRLVVKYRSNAAGKVPLVALSILGSDATKLFHVDNVTRNETLPLCQEAGQYVCTIPKLPLTPGLYQINACLLLNEITVDHIWTAATLEVLPGDYYSVGKVAEHFGSMMYVEHEWE